MEQSDPVRTVESIDPCCFGGARFEQRTKRWMLHAAGSVISNLRHSLGELQRPKCEEVGCDDAIFYRGRRFCSQSLVDDLAQQHFSRLDIVPEQAEQF